MAHKKEEIRDRKQMASLMFDGDFFNPETGVKNYNYLLGNTDPMYNGIEKRKIYQGPQEIVLNQFRRHG